MNILPNLENGVKVVDVLRKQTKCMRCKQNILTDAFSLNNTSLKGDLVCTACVRDDEKDAYEMLTPLQQCARFGILIFNLHSSEDAEVFVSNATKALSMDPTNDGVSRKMFFKGKILSVPDALSKFLEWERIRKKNQLEQQQSGLQPWALRQAGGASWKDLVPKKKRPRKEENTVAEEKNKKITEADDSIVWGAPILQKEKTGWGKKE